MQGFPGHRDGPSISGAKNKYRRGVCAGNYAEEVLAEDFKGRPGFLLDKGGAFDGLTTAAATYTAEGKTGAPLATGARRDDIFLKYVKYGQSTVLPADKTSYYASTSQLAYGGGVAASAGAGADGQGCMSPPRVQDCLWGADKFQNRKVPVSVNACSASEQRRRQLEAEAAASPYTTVEKDTLAAAAHDPAARLAARPPIARPRDPEGADTQVGRKAHGDAAALFDKDFLRIGLRKR